MSMKKELHHTKWRHFAATATATTTADYISKRNYYTIILNIISIFNFTIQYLTATVRIYFTN